MNTREYSCDRLIYMFYINTCSLLNVFNSQRVSRTAPTSAWFDRMCRLGKELKRRRQQNPLLTRVIFHKAFPQMITVCELKKKYFKRVVRTMLVYWHHSKVKWSTAIWQGSTVFLHCAFGYWVQRLTELLKGTTGGVTLPFPTLQ